MATDAERSAVAQTIFRAANEAILGPSRREGRLSFICECGSETCLEAIELTVEEYESVRADGRCFAVRADHEGEGEAVLARLETFTLVEKTGVGARIATLRNPRGDVRD